MRILTISNVDKCFFNFLRNKKVFLKVILKIVLRTFHNVLFKNFKLGLGNSSAGSRFGSQHLCGSSQPPITSVSGYAMPFSGTAGTRNTRGTHMDT